MTSDTGTIEGSGLMDVGLEPVPQKRRNMGFWSMFTMWFMGAIITSAVTAMAFITEAVGDVYGSVLTYSVGLIIGGLLSFMVMALAAQRTGLTNSTLLRSSLGIRGAMLPAAIIVIEMCIWNAMMFVIAGWAWEYAMGEFGITSGISSWMVGLVVVGVASAIIPIFKIGLAKWVQIIAAPILLVIFVIALIVMVIDPNFSSSISSFNIGTVATQPLITGIELGFAMALSWAFMAGDTARFASSRKAAWLGAPSGWIIGSLLCNFIGAFGLALYGTTDPSGIFAVIFWPFLIGIFLATVGTNIVDNISGAYSFLNIAYGSDPKRSAVIKPWMALLGVGIVSLALGFFGGDIFIIIPLLEVMGLILAPLAGIFLIDWWFNPQKRATLDPEMLLNTRKEVHYWGGFNKSAILATIVGWIAYGILYYTIGGRTGIAFPSIVSFFAAGGVYWIMLAVKPKWSFVEPRN